jgi:hypothetical protein
VLDVLAAEIGLQGAGVVAAGRSGGDEAPSAGSTLARFADAWIAPSWRPPPSVSPKFAA